MLIDSFEAEKIVEAYYKGSFSAVINFDLRFTQKQILIKDDKIIIDEIPYDIEFFEKIVKKPAIFLLEETPKIIAFYDEKYYKLEPIQGTAPTIEIDGIRMHRTKHVTPLEDARRKIRTLDISSEDYVLDVCTGLGYTAIESYRRKADVTTIEKDSNVIEIAEHNPYSAELFEGIEKGKIKLIMEDAVDAVKAMPKESFSAILHDPPRFSLAGELYSGRFYGYLYKVIEKEGRMLHYVGRPGSKYRGKDFISGVEKRLAEVGFKVERTEDNESVLAYK